MEVDPKKNSNLSVIKPAQFTNMQQGLITESAVSYLLLPQTSVQESINFNFDQIGSATVRLGLTQVGLNLGNGVNQGLFEFRDALGVNNWLIAANGGVIYKFSVSQGAWAAISGGSFSGTNKIRFTQFLNYMWVVDGNSPLQIWDGVSGDGFITTGNALNGPVGCSLIENFRSRVWIANNATYPSRIFYSEVPSAAILPQVTWLTDPVTGDWIDIAPQDGDQLTGLCRAPDALLAFKTNALYRIWSVNQTEPDPTIFVGTYSNESIVKTKAGIFFHHSSGFYYYLNGTVTDVSQPIIDIINAIPASAYSSIVGWLEDDGNHVCWSVGTISYRGKTYTNLTVRFTISTQVWTHYSYPNPFVSSHSYNDGTNLNTAVLDNIGNVLNTNVGKNDNGKPIFCSLVSNINTFDNSLATTSHITKIMFAHTNLAGFKIQWQTTEDYTNDWSKSTASVGELSKYDTYIQNAKIVGRGLLFRISGVWNGTSKIPGSYNGYEISE